MGRYQMAIRNNSNTFTLNYFSNLFKRFVHDIICHDHYVDLCNIIIVVAHA